MLVVGVDEAGYGPNLGPLAIGLTAWRVPEATPVESLFDLLARGVSQTLDGSGRVPIADSKRLYSPSTGLGLLESAVATLLDVKDAAPRTVGELWELLAADPSNARREAPWHGADDDARALPAASALETARQFAERLRESLDDSSVQLTACRARAVFPSEFNAACDRWGGKGAVLTHHTLQLVCDALAEVQGEDACVLADKHGGRTYYGAALQYFFPEAALRVVNESRACSEYVLSLADRKVRILFSAGGESQLPTAAASMIAKYLREVSVLAFNEYWASLLPGLRPTAGYPTDAKRFWADIEPVRDRTGLSNDALWRRR